jgi:MATE family multidrug resistance protein
MTALRSIRREMPTLLRLAVPIVLGEVGWMSMNFVDLAMIGRVGPTALAAVSVGTAIFLVFAIVCEGTMLGSDALISQHFGAGRTAECLRTLWAGTQLAVPLGFAAALLVAASTQLLEPVGIAPEITREATPFLYAMACGLPAQMGFVAMRLFLQGTHRVRIIAFAMISANLVNVVANYALIFGHWGMPALGATGSGIATTLARFYMMAVLLFYIARCNRRNEWRLASYAREFYRNRISEILRRGVPAAAQIGLEMGAFSGATLLAGRLGAVAVSGHQIALLMASLTFMVPLGMAQATSVRVGNAIGKGDAEAARLSGWSGIALSACFMSCAAVVLWTLPGPIVRIFTSDPQVTAVGVSLLAIAAVFQFFDGVQVTAIGAVRGSGNTRIAMVTDFVGWWLVGLPLGAWLCFGRGWGVRGLWIGLSAGLISISIAMAFAWSRRVAWMRRELRERATTL